MPLKPRGFFHQARQAAIAREKHRRSLAKAGDTAGLKEARAALIERLHPTQRNVLDVVTESSTRYLALFCGRRWGKTDLAQTLLILTATARKCAVVYASTTHNRAVKTVWAEMVEWSIPFGGVADIANKEIHYPNGSVFYCLGFETKKLADRIRGIKKIALVVVDECQDQDSEILEYAVGSVIHPALADLEGRLIMQGTGGAPTTFWERVVNGLIDLTFTVFRHTIWDNPHIPNPDAEVADACKLRGVTRDDPYIRREWGNPKDGIEFTIDGERSAMPAVTMRFVEPLPGGRIVVGADLGSVDLTGVCAVWLHPNYNGMIILRAQEKHLPGYTEQAAFINDFITEFEPLSSKPVLCALDPNGGKALIPVLAKLRGEGGFMPPEKSQFQVAQKSEKAATVRLMADDFRTGFLTLQPGNEALARALGAVEWKPGGAELAGHAPDIFDATLYCWRLARRLFRYEGPERVETVEPGLAAFLKEQEAEQEALAEYGIM